MKELIKKKKEAGVRGNLRMQEAAKYQSASCSLRRKRLCPARQLSTQRRCMPNRGERQSTSGPDSGRLIAPLTTVSAQMCRRKTSLGTEGHDLGESDCGEI